MRQQVGEGEGKGGGGSLAKCYRWFILMCLIVGTCAAQHDVRLCRVLIVKHRLLLEVRQPQIGFHSLTDLLSTR